MPITCTCDLKIFDVEMEGFVPSSARVQRSKQPEGEDPSIVT